MRREVLDKLHCPYSGTSFIDLKVMKGEGGAIDYGIVTSEAGDFPIVAGILRLQLDPLRRPIVEQLRRRRLDGALVTAVDVSLSGQPLASLSLALGTAYRKGFDRFARGLERFKRPRVKALAGGPARFREAVESFAGGKWAAWQVFRFSMPTFLPVYPLLHLIRPGDRVLDFGSGVGHAAFLMSRITRETNLICADYSFASLYLARKFFVSAATFVCLDGDYPLPFESEHFSVVFSSDTLHCIDSRLALSQEFRRVVSRDGIIVLPHLHNRLSGVQYGTALSPKGYDNLFDGMERRAVPEESLFRSFVENDVLDLEKIWTMPELESSARGLSIIASNNSSVFQTYRNLWTGHIERMANPVLNPVYRIIEEPGRAVLRRDLPDFYGIATGNALAGGSVLPEFVEISDGLDGTRSLCAWKEAMPSVFGGLAKSFVAIDVPDGFLK